MTYLMYLQWSVSEAAASNAFGDICLHFIQGQFAGVQILVWKLEMAEMPRNSLFVSITLFSTNKLTYV